MSASAPCRRTPTRCWATPTLDGVGYVVAEVSPYEFDLDWGELNEPDEMASVVDAPRPGHGEGALRLRRGQRPVPGQLPDGGGDLRGRSRGGATEFVADLTDFALDYAVRVRRTTTLFVDAFREGRIGGVKATRSA